MARYFHVITLLLFLLALGIVQGRQDQPPAKDGADRLSEPENHKIISPQPPKLKELQLHDHSILSSIQIKVFMVAHRVQGSLLQLRGWTKTKYGGLASASGTALLSAGTQLTETFQSSVDYGRRTYRFLIAAREYWRAVGKSPDTTGYATLIRNRSNMVGSATQQKPGPSLDIVLPRNKELEQIAALAGLRLEEVPLLALKLERAAWLEARISSSISDSPVRWAQFWWRRVLTGFWTTKVVLAFGTIWRGCFPDAGTATCQSTLVGVTVIYNLATIYEWLDTVKEFFTA